MTDGIIQEVFKSNNVPNFGFYNYTNHEVRMIIERIQQELIENIKQEFQYCKPLLSLDKYTTLQKRLIGDSNE